MDIDFDAPEFTIVDTISADTIEAGDLLIIEGTRVEVRSVEETDDIDEVLVKAYSHDSGDVETFSLYADDYFDVWTV